jgi:hypothetical protein
MTWNVETSDNLNTNLIITLIYWDRIAKARNP